MANETSRPGGFHSQAPNERWRIRLLLMAEERESFQTSLDAFRNEVRIERDCTWILDRPCGLKLIVVLLRVSLSRTIFLKSGGGEWLYQFLFKNRQ
jgi:hypothetical protein